MLAAMVLIERFDSAVDKGRLRTCHEIVLAAQAVDDPTLPARSFAGFASWWTHGYNSNPRQPWLATDETGNPVGCYLLELPDRENLTVGECFLAVSPTHRRRGAGTELLAHCAAQARLAGRTRLVTETREESAGAAFAAAVGATSGIAEVMRQLAVDDALRARAAALRPDAEQRAQGYKVFSWLGATPDEQLGEHVKLEEAMADAPRDAGIETERWDPDRIRAMQQSSIDAGHQLYAVAARHEATGEMAALTQVATDPGNPGWGFQQITAVLSGHRGHRLGMLVKIEMLDLLAQHEPGLKRIVTGNAGLNKHMIAINDQLGFEVTSAYRTWEYQL